MKALVYHGPGQKAWEEVPKPTLIDDTDAIVRVDAVTICGTDLHILKGDVPAVTDGRILGHEAVGTVESVGAGVKTVKVGDRVLVSCITACGTCRFCREGRYGQCLGGGGWILGHMIDGTQAEYVRVPFADTSTYPLPAGVTTRSSSCWPTSSPPATRSASSTARSSPATSSPSSAPARSGSPRSWAPGCSAPATSSPSTWPTAGSRQPSSSAPTSSSTTAARTPPAIVRELTGGLGADVAIEAVGVPATFELADRAGPPRRSRRQHRRARRAGHAAPRGPLDQRTSRSPPGSSTPTPPRRCSPRRTATVDAGRFVTHHFPLDDMEAYDVFARAGDTGALKVVLTRQP